MEDIKYHFIVTVLASRDTTEKAALDEVHKLLSESTMFKGGEVQAADKIRKQ